MTERPAFSEDELKILKLGRELEALIAVPGWESLRLALEENANQRLMKVLQPAESMDGVLKLEFEKGALFGIRHVFGTAYATIATCKEMKAQLSEKEEVDA